MLNNLRRKRVQRFDIEEWQCYNLKSDIWWKGVVVACKDTNMTISKQRYSKKKMTKPFDYDLDTVKKLVTTRNYVNSMILCSSGSFIKGHEKEYGNNKPQEMKIEKSFLLGETEITQELYCAVMNVKNPSRFQDNPKNPVEMVSWYDALIFCNKLSDMFGLERYYTITKGRKIIDKIESKQNYVVDTNKESKGFRLPTEWEWEYAAKADTQLLYSGSDDVKEVGWYNGNSKVNGKSTTHPVKQLKPNAWGFYDMSGNVWEWCESGNDSDSFSFNLVFRGGSWDDYSYSLRSAFRKWGSPDNRHGYLGFRVCRYI